MRSGAPGSAEERDGPIEPARVTQVAEGDTAASASQACSQGASGPPPVARALMARERLSVRGLADFLGAAYEGDGDRSIRRVASLTSPAPDALAFATSARRLATADLSALGALLVRATDWASLGPEARRAAGVAPIFVAHPHLAFARVLARFFGPERRFTGVHPRAVVADDVRVPETCSIDAGAVVEAGVRLGERVQIGANAWIGRGVVLADDVCVDAGACIYPDCEIGARSRIFARAVIGAEGFGFADQGAGRGAAGDRWVRVPHLGRVVIGMDVEVGAGSTIDRGALDDTVIENGVKIDNLVHIGHNCRIGANSALAGCVGLAGSAVIGRDCQLAGGVGVVGHTEMCDGVVALGMTMVSRSIDRPGVVASGVPHQDARTWHRMLATLRRLARGSAAKGRAATDPADR